MRIITGRSKSGKSEYIYSEIERLDRKGEETILIVPEQFSHTAEKRLLARIDAIREDKTEVFSFGHLCTAVEKRLGYPESININSVSKALIIKDIIKNCDLKFYTDAEDKNGFSDLISSSIAEFKKYMLTPDMLDDISKKSEEQILKLKLSDLSEIYRLYEEKVSQKYKTDDDTLTVLAKRLKSAPVFKNKHVFIDGFSTFVPQELDIIACIAENCRELTISLCYDARETNTTLFMPTSDTLSDIKRRYKGQIVIQNLEETHFTSPEIAHLERNLYTFPSRSYNSSCTDIKVYSLANPLSEVENCASFIKKLIREDGYMYRDIGIICSDIDVYSHHIERVFSHADIEYFLDEKNDVINHHLIRFVLGLIEIYTREYSYDSIFNYLKACFVSSDSAHISMLERFIQKRNVRRSTWLDDIKWNSLIASNYDENSSTAKELNKIRDEYILPLAKMHESIKGRHTVREDAEIFYNYLVFLNMPDTIAKYIDKFNSEGELRLAKEYEKIWDIITSSLDEMVNLCGEQKVSPKGFYDLLVTAFSQYKVGFIPSAVDKVLVGNTERTRFEGIKALFVLGVNETVFPIAPKPDGVLGDADKDAMKTLGYEFSTTSSVASYYSQFCAYSVFTMPMCKLFVSYSKTDNDFKSLRKSYIIDRICKIFNIKEISESSIDDMHYIHSLEPLKELLCSKMSQYSEGCDVSPVWRSVYGYFAENTDLITRISKFMNSDNIAVLLSEENIKALIPMLSHTSVSKIERYMACKYAFFIDYVLNLDVPKESTVDALEIGNITHEVLERLSREFGMSRDSLEKADNDTVLSRTEEYINDYIAKFTALSDDLTPRQEYAFKRLKNTIFMSFLAVKNQILSSSFEPLGYEIEFNDSSEVGSISLKTSSGKSVTLTGKIDRADICHTDDGSFVRVIDYKTGDKEFKLDDVLYGLSVQLMVYLNKLVSSDESFKHGGAMYFPVKETFSSVDGRLSPEEAKRKLESSFKFKGIVPFEDKLLDMYDENIAKSLRHGSAKDKRISLKGFETMDDYLKNKLGLICDNILDGDFSVSPCKKNNFTPCEYCDYLSVCRFDPSEGRGDYTRYKSLAKYDEIIKEMEEMLDVDPAATDSN